MKQTGSLNAMRVLLPMLVLSLSGCATKLPPPTVCPPLPSPPSVSTPQPSESYSESVSQRLSDWRQRLMDTPLIPEPSMELGRDDIPTLPAKPQ